MLYILLRSNQVLDTPQLSELSVQASELVVFVVIETEETFENPTGLKLVRGYEPSTCELISW